MPSEAYLRRKLQEDKGILEPVAAKRCRRCGEVKDRSEFPASTKLSDGLLSWCRSCAVERTRQWRAENRDEYNRRQRARYAVKRDA